MALSQSPAATKHRRHVSIAFVVMTLTTGFGLCAILANAQEENAQFKPERQGAQAFATSQQWDKAIQCYKRIASLPYGSGWLSELAAGLEQALKERPLDPDGHIALGLIYQNSLNRNYHPLDHDYLSDYGQSEGEFRTAISLSAQHKNAEAEKLLAVLPALKDNARAQNTKHHYRYDTTPDLYEQLLTFRWTPPRHEGFLLTRIQATDDNWNGIVRPRIIVPSGSTAHDQAAVQLVQTAIDDFPLLHWWSQQFAVMSGDGIAKVTRVPPGAVGKLELLALHGSESLGDAAVVAKSYVKSRWSSKRICDYCRPENSKPLCMRDHGFFGVAGHKVISGTEGVAKWFCGVVNGVPTSYLVYVDGGGFWYLERGSPSLKSNSDDQFVMQRIRDTLFSCLRNYELVHLTELHWQAWNVRRSDGEGEQLLRDKDDKVTAYVCKLSGGSVVTAELNEKLSITSLLVDGQRDPAWNQAYSEAVANIEKLGIYGY